MTHEPRHEESDVLRTPRGGIYQKLKLARLERAAKLDQPISETKRMHLGPHTKVSLATVGSVLVVGASATLWVVSTIQSEFKANRDEVAKQATLTREKFGEFDSRMVELTRTIEGLKTTAYTKAEASELALRTAIANPGLRVPDPRESGKIIVVETRP